MRVGNSCQDQIDSLDRIEKGVERVHCDKLVPRDVFHGCRKCHFPNRFTQHHESCVSGTMLTSGFADSLQHLQCPSDQLIQTRQIRDAFRQGGVHALNRFGKRLCNWNGNVFSFSSHR